MALPRQEKATLRALRLQNFAGKCLLWSIRQNLNLQCTKVSPSVHITPASLTTFLNHHHKHNASPQGSWHSISLCAFSYWKKGISKTSEKSSVQFPSEFIYIFLQSNSISNKKMSEQFLSKEIFFFFFWANLVRTRIMYWKGKKKTRVHQHRQGKDKQP